MANLIDLNNKRKQLKIERLMRDNLWDIVRTPKAQRNLVWIVLLAPAGLALGYVIYFGGTYFLAFGLLTAVVLAVSGTLLQKSVRKITVLPEQYLDERQIAVRDRAYRVAYRRLSQAGFAVWIVAFVFAILGRLGAYTAVSFWVDKNSGTLLFSGHETQNFGQWLTYWSWFQFERSLSNPWGVYLLVSLLVWYVWATPVAIIAWNEAKHGGGVKRD